MEEALETGIMTAGFDQVRSNPCRFSKWPVRCRDPEHAGVRVDRSGVIAVLQILIQPISRHLAEGLAGLGSPTLHPRT
jgi:hypothetical protein